MPAGVFASAGGLILCRRNGGNSCDPNTDIRTRALTMIVNVHYL